MAMFFIANGRPSAEKIAEMNKATRDWELRAARGECEWICADCCLTFSEGMPDACEHGHQSCTDLIQRDKRAANSSGQGAGR